MRPGLERATGAIRRAFDLSGIDAAGQVAPAQLIEAVDQFFRVFDKLDQERGERSPVLYDDVSRLGDHAIGCLADLEVWAERLGLPQEKQELQSSALDAAEWVIRHGGEIRTLEPVVDAFAAAANGTESRADLSTLFARIHAVIQHVAPALQSDLEKTDPARPWRILNFNFAIVATRTQDPDLMALAFNTLEHHLPEECPAFFEEGLKQAEKPVYGPMVKEIMARYRAKWTTRH